MSRILWNERGGEIDEIVAHNVTVHIEQMSDSCWWLSITDAAGGRWAGNIYSASGRAKVTFTEQENDGLVWDEDDAHEERAS